MKQPKYFWVIGKADGIFNEGKSLSLSISRIDVKGADDIIETLKGRSPWFEDTPFQCYSLIAGGRGNGYLEIQTGEALGHQVTEGAEMAVLCTFNETLSQTATCGLEVHGWALLHVYTKVRHDVGAHNSDVFKRKEQLHEARLRERNCPIRLFHGGKMVQIGTGDEFARYFEYKGWPAGVELSVNVCGRWVRRDDLPMLPMPKVRNNNRPNWKGEVLEQLFESVKDRQVIQARHEVMPEENTAFKHTVRVVVASEAKDLTVPLGAIIDQKLVSGEVKKVEVAKTGQKTKTPNRPRRRAAVVKKYVPVPDEAGFKGEGTNAAA